MRPTGIAAGAVGALAMGFGVYMSTKVVAAKRDTERLFDGNEIVDPVTLSRKDSDGRAYQTAQWIGYGLGVAALAAGATLFVIGSPRGAEGEGSGTTVSLAPLAGAGVLGAMTAMRF